MKIKIEIECDSVYELMAHIMVIKSQIRGKQRELNLHEDWPFEKKFTIDDNNCYGTHIVKLQP